MEEQISEAHQREREIEIEIEVSTDGMNAYLTINKPLFIGKVIHQLWSRGVNFGIKGPAIQNALDTESFGKSFVVAEGQPPLDGQDATIEYRFARGKKVNIAEDEDGRIDFRESGSMETVRRGEVLAIKKTATQGIPGRTVTGKTIKAKDGRDIEIPTGENNRLSNDGLALIAVEDGYVFWEDGKINVGTTYEVDGDVDMTIGNIYFVGPVKIKGSVHEGFIVNAEGDIEIGEGIENATLRANGNITIVNGIIGKRCFVYVRGDLKCKFIENATVEVKGNVIVHDAILHSNIEADGSVTVLSGKKGAIIGGRVSAGEEVNAKNIGSISEAPTRIEAGIKPHLRREIKDLEEYMAEDSKELRELRLRYNTLKIQNKLELASEVLAKQKELRKRLKKTTEELIQLKKHIATEHKGKISVFEKIWPSVQLTIGTTPLLLKIDDRYATFVERLSSIERLEYQKPKISGEPARKQVKYWEREIDGR